MSNPAIYETHLLPCQHCGCDDIRRDHPSRAPRVYCCQCRATAESPMIWNSRPEDWNESGGVLVEQIANRVSRWKEASDGL